MYIVNLIRDIRLWREVARVTKGNREKFNAIGFDVDWVGRIYTIIDIPDDLMKLPTGTISQTVEKNTAIDLHIKEGLRNLSKLTTELQIMDSLEYPDNYELLEGTSSILVVFAPIHKSLTKWKVTGFALAVAAVVSAAVWSLVRFL